VLTGSVLVPVEADKMASASPLKYKASKGKQQLEAFEDAAPDVLENTLDEQVGLSVAETQTYEEAVEISSAH
jgi:hypothetical protein